MSAVIGTSAIVIVFAVVGLWIDRKYGLWPRPDKLVESPKPKSKYAVGEAPSVAIRAGASQLAKLRASQRCPSCRSAMTNDTDDTVQYNERALLVLHFACTKCATKRSMYVEAAA